MKICYICGDGFSERPDAFRHAISHLRESARESLLAIDMMEDFTNLREPRDLILVRWYPEIRSANRNLVSMIDEIKGVWEADQ